MLKATMKMPDGHTLLTIGLSFKNLDKFRTEPGDTFIKINGAEMDLPIDIIIFSGETEVHMHEKITGFIDGNTKIYIDPKLKS